MNRMGRKIPWGQGLPILLAVAYDLSSCRSALDAESTVPILDSCFRRNDKLSIDL
jgi:hypothetical protein